MTDINYNDHASKATPTVDDFVPIWDVAAGQSKKATIANLINARLTGGGIIATGGFTLTVPATGTAALLGQAQTFTQINTFSAGINLGGSNLSHYEIGDWTPGLVGSTTAGTQTYTSQVGRYVRIGMFFIGFFAVTLDTKGGTMAGDVLLTGFPFSVRSTGSPVQIGTQVIPVSLATNVVWLQVRATPSATTGTFRKMTAAATQTSALVVADIQNGTSLNGTVMFEIAP